MKMRELDFDCDFSDRDLRLEIIQDSNTKSRKLNLDNAIGDEAHSNDPDLECSDNLQVKTWRISSHILAAKSPFFYKLLKNGMRESHEKHFTLRIKASEEAPLMDLLNFMYNYTLSATTILDLLDVLIVADKFEVISCMNYCIERLLKLPMSLESALIYLELPSNVLMAEAVEPLKDAIKQYQARLNKLQDEAMALPLHSIMVVLDSDDLQVRSEDDVYDFILEWARAHYPNPLEQREILNKMLVQFVRFPYMSCLKLEKIRLDLNFDKEHVSKLVREAIFFKSGVPCDMNVDSEATHRRFVERAYEYRPVKVVQLQCSSLSRCCVVLFDLKRDECANLFLSNEVYSLPFNLGETDISLVGICNKEGSDYYFGLQVYVWPDHKKTYCTLSYEFEVMKKKKKKKPSEKYESMFKVNDHVSRDDDFTGTQNLFGIPWSEFMANDSEYFIDDILHLRAEIKLN